MLDISILFDTICYSISKKKYQHIMRKLKMCMYLNIICNIQLYMLYKLLKSKNVDAVTPRINFLSSYFEEKSSSELLGITKNLRLLIILFVMRAF